MSWAAEVKGSASTCEKDYMTYQKIVASSLSTISSTEAFQACASVTPFFSEALCSRLAKHESPNLSVSESPGELVKIPISKAHTQKF